MKTDISINKFYNVLKSCEVNMKFLLLVVKKYSMHFSEILKLASCKRFIEFLNLVVHIPKSPDTSFGVLQANGLEAVDFLLGLYVQNDGFSSIGS